MKFSLLGSGSKGNSLYIESGSTAILIDAGFSGKELQKRMATIGRLPENLKAICVTHEHADHVGGVGVMSRRYNLRVWGNEGTLRGSERLTKKIPDAQEFDTGDILQIGNLEVRSFSTVHDTADPVGYVISDGKKQIGYCTDTGHITHLMASRLANCDGLVLECNHDPDLLRDGPYPLQLQQRVRSRQGHLSNEAGARLLKDIYHDGLQMVFLAHLSEQNNTPEHVQRAVSDIVRDKDELQVLVAKQHEASPLIQLV
ncbi:MAG: MBL fold metallo-hydrolase [Desulfotalea sp.]